MGQDTKNAPHEFEILANEAVKYVNEEEKIESLNRQGDTSKPDYQEKHGLYTELKEKGEICRNEFKLALNEVTPAYIHQYAESIKKAKVGKSEEFAYLAYHYLDRKKVSPLDIVKLDGGHHYLVVIGRDAKAEGYNPANMATWGEHAYVCDALLRDVYAVSKFKDKSEKEASLKIKQNYKLLGGSIVLLKAPFDNKPAVNPNALFTSVSTPSPAPTTNQLRAKL